MSYTAIKDGIVGILKGQAFVESPEIANFDNASTSLYGNAFIIRCESGEIDADRGDVNGRFFDRQSWSIQIAWARSAHNDTVNRDEAHKARETLQAKLDNPANTSSFVREMRYQGFLLEELDNFILLTINLEIIDVITLT